MKEHCSVHDARRGTEGGGTRWMVGGKTTTWADADFLAVLNTVEFVGRRKRVDVIAEGERMERSASPDRRKGIK